MKNTTIKWKVTKDGDNHSVYANSPKEVYDIVARLTNDVEAAIEASSWAELAYVGEVYETRDVVIEVVDLEDEQ